MNPKMRNVFPLLLLLLNLGASVASFIAHDWKRGVYWAAGAIGIAMIGLDLT